MSVAVQECPSPNLEPRAPGAAVDLLVLHYTGMKTEAEALARLCDPAAKVSAHYLIGEDGRIRRLVAEDCRAWHAGVAAWRGIEDINGRSIGIELVNPGHEFGYRAFPQVQMKALVALAREIIGRHPIPPRNVVGHSDVAPSRKTDPGELFDWQYLAGEGIGLWPRMDYSRLRGGPSLGEGDTGEDALDLQRALVDFGYGVKADGVFGPRTKAAVTAFQRHFRPGLIDGRADGECAALLGHLCGLAAQG